MSKSFINEKSLHILIVQIANLLMTKEFLGENRDLIYRNADMGDTTVLMKRSEYIHNMDDNNFDKLD